MYYLIINRPTRHGSVQQLGKSLCSRNQFHCYFKRMKTCSMYRRKIIECLTITIIIRVCIDLDKAFNGLMDNWFLHQKRKR